MSIDRTMTLGEAAMENWPKTSEQNHHEKLTPWPAEFDVHYLRSANLPFLQIFDQCLC